MNEIKEFVFRFCKATINCIAGLLYIVTTCVTIANGVGDLSTKGITLGLVVGILMALAGAGVIFLEEK